MLTGTPTMNARGTADNLWPTVVPSIQKTPESCPIHPWANHSATDCKSVAMAAGVCGDLVYQGTCNKADCKFKHNLDYKRDPALLSAAINKAQSRQESKQDTPLPPAPADTPRKVVGLNTFGLTNPNDCEDSDDEYGPPAITSLMATRDTTDRHAWVQTGSDSSDDDTDYDAVVCMTASMPYTKQPLLSYGT